MFVSLVTCKVLGTRLFLLAIFAFQVYRAATQSLTIDEANMYMAFARPGPSAFLGTYDAGHHMLYTYLEWMLSSRFGSSELVLRIPALIACAGYLVFVFQFVRRFCPTPILQIGAAMILAANPLLLDHLAAARGYGLALALFAWAMLKSIDALADDSGGALTAAGVLTGLSIAANLTFLFPAVALAAVTFAMRPRLSWVNEFFGPAVVFGVLLVVVPLSNVKAGDFYYGTPAVINSLRDLLDTIFRRKPLLEPLAKVGWLVLALFSAVILWGATAVRRSRPAAIVLGTFAGGLSLMLGAHWVFGALLPIGRTGLWLVFLFTLAAVIAIAQMPKRASMALAAVCLVIGAVYGMAVDPRFFGEWRYDAQTKQWMRLIHDREAGRGRTFTVSGTGLYQFSANYYRMRFKLNKMNEYNGTKLDPTADYYLVADGDAPKVAGWNLRVVARDGLCECFLAEAAR